MSDKIADVWRPRLAAMAARPSEWFDATELWAVESSVVPLLDELHNLLWREFRDPANPSDPGFRLIQRRTALGPDRVDRVSGATVPGRWRIELRVVPRGVMVELENDEPGARYHTTAIPGTD